MCRIYLVCLSDRMCLRTSVCACVFVYEYVCVCVVLPTPRDVKIITIEFIKINFLAASYKAIAFQDVTY